MGFNEFLSKLFGNKATRDMKEIVPWVEKVKAAYPDINKLSNDELRAKTKELQKFVKDSATDLREKIDELKSKVEETELEQREGLFAQIDKLEKEVLDRYEKALDEILPQAFAIVKDTARRFAENAEIEVTATDFDRELAATKTSSASRVTRQSIRTTGWREVPKSRGTWCTMMYSSSVVSCCTKARLPRWLPVKVRPWWLPFRCSSMP